MPILLKEDYKYPLPKLVSVEQIFDHLEIEDVEEKTKREFEKEEIRQKIHIGDKVAIAVGSRGIQNLRKILYIIFDYSHKHYTFKQFEVQKIIQFTTNLPRLSEP